MEIELTQENLNRIEKLKNVYKKMKERCYDTRNKNFHNYGGRGIVICEEWKNNKTLFIEWGLLNGFEIGLTIDRIDVNGNYEPKNCRWLTNQEQQNNRRNNHYITYNGETKSARDWAIVLDIKIGKMEKMLYRKKMGTIEEWIEYIKKQEAGEIKKGAVQRYSYNNMTMKEISEKYNIKLITLYARRKRNPDITFEELVEPTNTTKRNNKYK